MSGEFTKYRDRGAYHWNAIRGGILRRNPREDAKYEVVLREVRRHFDLAGSRGIEAGCGDGVLLYKLRLAGGSVVGLDLTPEGLQLGRRELVARGISGRELIAGACEALPMSSSSVDYVVSVETIEHLANLPAFLSEVRRVLRPEGWFVCTTPNRGDAPAGSVQDPFHVREFVADELRDVLSEYLDDVEVTGRIPAWLDRIYLRDRRQRARDKLVRVLFRLVAFGIGNPYCMARATSIGPNWSILLGAGRKGAGTDGA